MEQEDKELLLKYLSARLQYGVRISVNDKIETLQGINVLDDTAEYDIFLSSNIEEVKPYLFPLSSMTEEQEKEISKRYNYHNYYDGLCIEITYHSEGYWDTDTSCNLQDYLWLEEFFNKNHFDYRGLIEKGLAKDATNLNVY